SGATQTRSVKVPPISTPMRFAPLPDALIPRNSVILVPGARCRLARSGGGLLGDRRAEIGGDDLRITDHLLGCSLGNLAAGIDDNDPVADAGHCLHVVLDQPHGDTVPADIAQAGK